MHRVDYYQQVIPYLGGKLQQLEDPFDFNFTDIELSNVRNLMHRLRVKKPILLNLVQVRKARDGLLIISVIWSNYT